MERPADITVEDLRRALEAVDGKTPAQRLIAAIAYKNGITQTELADWFGVERKTIYNWLARLEEGDLAASARDESRPGRPRKLTGRQIDEIYRTLGHPPTDDGYDAPTWTTGLVQRYIRDRFDVDYSRPSCRRLMQEAGLH